MKKLVLMQKQMILTSEHMQRTCSLVKIHNIFDQESPIQTGEPAGHPVRGGGLLKGFGQKSFRRSDFGSLDPPHFCRSVQ